MQQRKRRPQKVSDTCPKCGYCDKCGRANAAPFIPYPYVPYVPPINPYPLYPWGYPGTVTWTTNTGNIAYAPIFDPSIHIDSTLWPNNGVNLDINSVNVDANGTISAIPTGTLTAN